MLNCGEVYWQHGPLLDGPLLRQYSVCPNECDGRESYSNPKSTGLHFNNPNAVRNISRRTATIRQCWNSFLDGMLFLLFGCRFRFVDTISNMNGPRVVSSILCTFKSGGSWARRRLPRFGFVGFSDEAIFLFSAISCRVQRRFFVTCPGVVDLPSIMGWAPPKGLHHRPCCDWDSVRMGGS